MWIRRDFADELANAAVCGGNDDGEEDYGGTSYVCLEPIVRRRRVRAGTG